MTACEALLAVIALTSSSKINICVNFQEATAICRGFFNFLIINNYLPIIGSYMSEKTNK